MAHLDHHTPTEVVDPVLAARNARLGLILFTVYSTLYLTFVLLNAFAPQVMTFTVFAGINLAVVYGLGLIAAAFVLALLYAWLCRAPAT
jgi:uncharacterized membrane protein (DUF485 family)